MVQSSAPHLRLPSPKLPLSTEHNSPLAYVARAEVAPLRPAFIAFSAAEFSARAAYRTSALMVETHVEKGVLDAFRAFNLTLSVTAAACSAVINEAMRSRLIPSGDAAAGDEPEEMDWLKAGSEFGLLLARDVGGATCQRVNEKLLKRRVSVALHDELIKSVPRVARKAYLLDVADGSGKLAASARAAARVLRSPLFYVSICVPRLFADVALDALRLRFPAEWRTCLTPPAFYRNARLKAIKYALQALASLAAGCLVPFVWAHPVAFQFSDMLAVYGTEMAVNSACGQVE